MLRPDVTAEDVLRLVHGIVMATEQSPEDTDRLLGADARRPAAPGAGERARAAMPGRGGEDGRAVSRARC